MKNRAKCKKCQSIIESFHRTDYVTCKCGEIAVYGGPDLMQCSAVNWDNFLRVDDLGNEIVVKVKSQEEKEEDLEKFYKSPNKEDLIKILDEMSKSIENLPTNAMNSPITHWDFQTLLMLLSSLFKLDLPKN